MPSRYACSSDALQPQLQRMEAGALSCVCVCVPVLQVAPSVMRALRSPLLAEPLTCGAPYLRSPLLAEPLACWAEQQARHACGFARVRVPLSVGAPACLPPHKLWSMAPTSAGLVAAVADLGCQAPPAYLGRSGHQARQAHVFARHICLHTSCCPWLLRMQARWWRLRTFWGGRPSLPTWADQARQAHVFARHASCSHHLSPHVQG